MCERECLSGKSGFYRVNCLTDLPPFTIAHTQFVAWDVVRSRGCLWKNEWHSQVTDYREGRVIVVINHSLLSGAFLERVVYCEIMTGKMEAIEGSMARRPPPRLICRRWGPTHSHLNEIKPHATCPGMTLASAQHGELLDFKRLLNKTIRICLFIKSWCTDFSVLKQLFSSYFRCMLWMPGAIQWVTWGNMKGQGLKEMEGPVCVCVRKIISVLHRITTKIVFAKMFQGWI